MAERIDAFAKNPFIDSPSEFLVKSVADYIRTERHFRLIFGDCVDAYKRLDYPDRALPALRVYNNSYSKTSEDWFVDGEMQLDVILPASLRRNELQQIQDTISSALLQQFRRPSFFEAMCAQVPGLNKLGATFNVDKDLGFQWGDDVVPLTQITVNFRIDLRKWDDYLESDDRTVDEPFDRVLGNLELLAGIIQGLNEAEDVKVTLGVTQKLED